VARTGHRGERKRGRGKKEEGKKEEGKRHVERTEKKNPEVYLRVLKGMRKFKVFLSHL